MTVIKKSMVDMDYKYFCPNWQLAHHEINVQAVVFVFKNKKLVELMTVANKRIVLEDRKKVLFCFKKIYEHLHPSCRHNHAEASDSAELLYG